MRLPRAWRRWLRVVRTRWRTLSLPMRIRAVVSMTGGLILTLTAVWLLLAFPWRGGTYHPRDQILAVLLIAAPALFLTITQFPDFARTYQYDIAFYIGLTAGLLTIGSKANRDFCIVTAQVVPLLFIALAFEGRSFHIRKDMDGRTRYYAALPAYGLLIAEWAALSGIIDDPASIPLPLMVGIMTMAGVALVLHALLGAAPGGDGDRL